MNNIKTIRAMNFIMALSKDKARITTIEPIVAFRNLLGMGEKLTTDTVIRSLTLMTSKLGVMAEFQTKLVKPAYIGEVITFDIGEDTEDNWCRFKIVREPLPNDPLEIAVNFILECDDKVNGKRYTRLIGAIQRETWGDNEHRSIFRTISDIIQISDIEKTDVIVFHKGDKVIFRPDAVNEHLAALTCDDKSHSITSDEFVNMRDTAFKIYTPHLDITEAMLNKGFSVFGYLDLIASKPWPNNRAPVIIIQAGTVYHVMRNGDELSFMIDGKSCATINDPAVLSMTPEQCKQLYTAKTMITDAFCASNPLSTILEQFEITDDMNEVVIRAGMTVELENLVGKYTAKKDITRGELLDNSNRSLLFDKVAEVIQQPKKEVKEEKMNEDPVIYEKDEEVVDGAGNKYRATKAISRSMLINGNDVPSDCLEPIVAPKVADIDNVVEHKPVGEVPQHKNIKDAETNQTFLRELFGTPAPTILHLMKTLNNESSSGEVWKATRTWQIETLVVYPTYTYSIIRRNNGAFYRVYVSFTDMDAVKAGDENIYFLKTGLGDKWLFLTDIADPEITQIMRRRGF